MQLAVTRVTTVLALILASGCSSSEPTQPPEAGSLPTTQPVASVSEPVSRPPRPSLDLAAPMQTLALGSCLDQNLPHPILDAIADTKPDAFLWLGDNVYADAETTEQLQAAYDKLGSSEVFVRFAQSVPQLAVWDDHDYGLNDSGNDYPLRAESKTIMLDFFDEPTKSARRARDGNYEAVVVGPQGQRIQLLLLDTRWFRDPLVADPSPGRRYQPTADRSTTVLGEAQWEWLEQQLKQPAELRLIVTSIQLLEGRHGYEGWWLFPHERARMFELLARSNAGGVVAVTGDRHRGEISCAQIPGMSYPLIELTASSLNKPLEGFEPNPYRLPETPLLSQPNFGVVEVRWGDSLELRLHDERGAQALAVSVPLAALQAGSTIDSGLDCKKFEM